MVSQNGNMTSSSQTISQIPANTNANGVKRTARQSNDHNALNDGHGVLVRLAAGRIIMFVTSVKFPVFATVVPAS